MPGHEPGSAGSTNSFYSTLVVVAQLFVEKLRVIPGFCHVPLPKQEKLLNSSWRMMGNDTRISLEKKLDCCGLFNNTRLQTDFGSDFYLCESVRIPSLFFLFLFYFGFLTLPYWIDKEQDFEKREIR